MRLSLTNCGKPSRRMVTARPKHSLTTSARFARHSSMGSSGRKTFSRFDGKSSSRK